MRLVDKIAKHSYDDKQKTTYVAFETKSQLNGEYWMRCGIVWPEFSELSGTMLDGFVLVMGQNVDTQKLLVFAEHRFSIVDTDHDVRTKKAIPSFAEFAGFVWPTLYADCYFWRGKERVYQRYRSQIMSSKVIVPKPFFIDLGINNMEEPYVSTYELMAKGRLEMPMGGEALSDATMMTSRPVEQLRALQALACCVYGMEKYAWKRKIEQ